MTFWPPKIVPKSSQNHQKSYWHLKSVTVPLPKPPKGLQKPPLLLQDASRSSPKRLQEASRGWKLYANSHQFTVCNERKYPIRENRAASVLSIVYDPCQTARAQQFDIRSSTLADYLNLQALDSECPNDSRQRIPIRKSQIPQDERSNWATTHTQKAVRKMNAGNSRLQCSRFDTNQRIYMQTCTHAHKRVGRSQTTTPLVVCVCSKHSW